MIGCKKLNMAIGLVKRLNISKTSDHIKLRPSINELNAVAPDESAFLGKALWTSSFNSKLPTSDVISIDEVS
jgi:hypothetical protein